MTPQFKPGDYVKAVKINGSSTYKAYEGRVGICRSAGDYGSVLGDFLVKFPGFPESIICHEIEPSTRADYDADWPDEEPATTSIEVCKKCGADYFEDSANPQGECNRCAPAFKTASAVLTAGNDALLQFLRLELEDADSAVAHEQAALNAAQIQLNIAASRQNTILDLIAARMDQLKGGEA